MCVGGGGGIWSISIDYYSTYFFFICLVHPDIRGRCTRGWEEGEKDEVVDEKEEKEEETAHRARTWAASKIDSGVLCVCFVCTFIHIYDVCIFMHIERARTLAVLRMDSYRA